MKVLVVGNGGREHALARKLLESDKVEQVFCLPGNGGTATTSQSSNYPINVDDFPKIAEFAKSNQIELVVVGPELPLSLGITDYLQKTGIKVFGPDRIGAQIESSKYWAKSFMLEAGIPTAQGEKFTDRESAKAYINQTGAPIVVKADGLAAGKGVIVANTVTEALNAVDYLFDSQYDLIVVEEYLVGEEVSILALTDGLSLRSLLPAQDHKRIGARDTGANTGGMGAYAPAPIVTPELMERIDKEVLQPTLATLQQRGIDYRGVLYAGLMITPEGEPKVLEFNCRFGDPETQAILPLLETPLIDLILACCDRQLAQQPPLAWYPQVSTCVVIAAGGYPGTYEKGKIISGIEQAEALGAQVFHAGTKRDGENIMTDGGRVLGVTATGGDFPAAIANAYQAVECIKFENMYYRPDIGDRVR
ncbi:phosphoribosylamine--glycine ligase [Merismopedia glauca]|uniref:Phosphoribosylamine--glycine ligase n=1 Tax=Merismopedia glauca CCAP 1448/3 TaxID=1296344 RepID=A0A2T1C123_9CYAN|nr:phosphoribosylamine--glycine ligase [Merismopedia glauca]PSB01969.1 phosphoribosylamine--glycine ligase [Merismopedia glauca CCAP 1448/3]